MRSPCRANQETVGRFRRPSFDLIPPQITRESYRENQIPRRFFVVLGVGRHSGNLAGEWSMNAQPMFSEGFVVDPVSILDQAGTYNHGCSFDFGEDRDRAAGVKCRRDLFPKVAFRATDACQSSSRPQQLGSRPFSGPASPDEQPATQPSDRDPLSGGQGRAKGDGARNEQ
jgi:hypothetical protein